MKNQTSAFITLIGRPNVGKSSLLNKLLGEKISIVTNKPQTTRTKVNGILTEDEKQFVFIDTPGFNRPHNLLGENMQKAVLSGLKGIDAAVFVVDGCPEFKVTSDLLPPAEAELIKILKAGKIRTVLVINKIDLIEDKTSLFGLIDAYTANYSFDAVVPLSAKNGDGIDILKTELKKYLKKSVHYFPDDTLTDIPERVLVAEMIREKLLLNLDKEIPHGTAVDIEKFSERDTASGEPIIDVFSVIYCEKKSGKGIIIGKDGQMLKKISISARRDIEKFFGTKVNLKLWVKVKENWRNIGSAIHSFGLDNL